MFARKSRDIFFYPIIMTSFISLDFVPRAKSNLIDGIRTILAINGYSYRFFYFHLKLTGISEHRVTISVPGICPGRTTIINMKK